MRHVSLRAASVAALLAVTTAGPVAARPAPSPGSPGSPGAPAATAPAVVVTPATGLADGQVVELAATGVDPTYEGAPLGPFPTGGWSTAQCDAALGAAPSLHDLFTHCGTNGALTPVTVGDDGVLPATPLPVAATLPRILGGTTDCTAAAGACVLGLVRLEASGAVTAHTVPLGFGEDVPPPAPEEYVGPVEGFYAAPDPVPAWAPGTLLRYQRIPDLDVAGATAYRIMYVSRSLQGQPIVVTGTSLVPPGAAPPGGRPLLAMGHGMTGIADQCAPSKFPGITEVVLTGEFVQAGYLVAMTDFEGLGTPGRHPFVVGESEGRGVLDGIRAARQLPGAQAGDRLAIAGYSQGGHGALFAGQIAEDWAPELDHVGTFAGGPGTELDIIAQVVPGVAHLAGVFYLGIAGFDAAYPEADLSLLLTPAGIEHLDVVDRGCAGEVYAHYAGLDPNDLLVPGYSTVEPWASITRANNPGHVVTEAPVLVFHSTEDELIPAVLSELMVQRMCANGQVVERVATPAGTHGAATGPAYQAAFDWFESRLSGEPPTSTCP
ncbi:MAG TPA: lipase family protein [Acidimicrobiales bacterium]